MRRILLPAMLFCSIAVFSSPVDSMKNAVSLVPSYLFNQGIRVDLERHLGTSKSWLVLSPMFYYGLTNTDGSARTSDFSSTNIPNYQGDQFLGYGLCIFHKLYPRKYHKYQLNPYFQYGVLYQHFDVSFQEYGITTFYRDGNKYYTYELGDHHAQIDRFTPAVIFGFQRSYMNVLTDFYIGSGICISSVHNDLPGSRNYKLGLLDLATQGTKPMIGIRVGLFHY